MDITQFWTICSANSIILTLEQLKSFERYRDELIYWNSKVNLISRKDEDNIFERHFLHSLAILKYVKIRSKSKCLDIGTGGGFPGLPIKIANPEINMMLIDSIRKKVKLTEMFAQHTGLRKIEVATIRAEDLAIGTKEFIQFDFIMARAVSSIKNIVDWSYKFLSDSGLYVLLKGGDLTDEIAELKQAYPSMKVREHLIDMYGCDSFKKDEKKIVIIGKRSLEMNDKVLRQTKE